MHYATVTLYSRSKSLEIRQLQVELNLMNEYHYNEMKQIRLTKVIAKWKMRMKQTSGQKVRLSKTNKKEIDEWSIGETIW